MRKTVCSGRTSHSGLRSIPSLCASAITALSLRARSASKPTRTQTSHHVCTSISGSGWREVQKASIAATPMDSMLAISVSLSNFITWPARLPFWMIVCRSST
jgi:hypothetical protein